MAKQVWSVVDDYLAEALIPADAVMDAVQRANEEARLPAIDVTATQGKFLHLLARIRGARRILEIGTLGGYSTIWMARALPADGRLITLEANPAHAKVAQANIERAGLSALVELRVGLGLDSLAKLKAEGAEAFDLIFIDADKPNNPNYLEWALKFSLPGTVIVLDNVIRDGEVADATSTDPMVIGVRKFFEAVAKDARVDATALQTVGNKGYDGFALLLVK